MRADDFLKNAFSKTLHGEDDGAFTTWCADRWRRQRWRWSTNGLPDLQAALGTFKHRGSAIDSRLHHCWCEAVKKSSRACSWLWCFDYTKACSCRSVQLVLCISFVSSAWLPFHLCWSPSGWPLSRRGDRHQTMGKLNLWSFFFPGIETTEACWSQIVDVLFWVHWGRSGIDTEARFNRNIHQEPPASKSISLTQQSICSRNHNY